MNSEQLNKINDLKKQLKNVSVILQEPGTCYFSYRFMNERGCVIEHHPDKKLMNQALIAYRDKLKAELKELEYEE